MLLSGKVNNLKCPFCNSELNRVVDKRSVEGRGDIRRRRECMKCVKRFTTYETLAKLQVLVIKKDNHREPYDPQKLRDGIAKALEKSPRIDRAEFIAERIEGKIRGKAFQEIASAQIGKWVLSELRKTDKVAYLRFASVYRTFSNPEDFEKELRVLRD